MIWLAGDWLLADALTKKSQDSRRSLLQFLSSGMWMLKYSPDFTDSAKKSKSKGLDAVSQIQSITGKRAEKNFEPMQQNWFPLISSLARWCDCRGPLAQSPSFASWIRPWAYRQWMEKQQLRRAAEPLVGLWILGISCLPCDICSIEIHFLSGTWDTSHAVTSCIIAHIHRFPSWIGKFVRCTTVGWKNWVLRFIPPAAQ